jgi:RNA-binding protein
VKKLSSTQAKFLRGLAHSLNPVVFVGQKGVTPALVNSAAEAFQRHELIKVKFVDFKEKKQKLEIAAAIENKTACRMAGMIGHVAIFFKQHSDPEKRRIQLPD